jgi:diketogulonate reductase-like aldo/keto reductase
VFLVSKVLPQHATRRGTIAACRASLKRLRTDRIDLYLLHWRGDVPLDETLEAFTTLVRDGDIRGWGVSNFDVDDMEELGALDGGSQVATDQVLYNLQRRGIERDLLPWCRERQIPIMAYTPLEPALGRPNATLAKIGKAHGLSPAQVALAWVLAKGDDIVPIPGTKRRKYLEENVGAAEVALTPADVAALDAALAPDKIAGPRYTEAQFKMIDR